MAGQNKKHWTAVVIYAVYRAESNPETDILNDAKHLQHAYSQYGSGCYLAQSVGELEFFREQGLIHVGTKLYILGHISDERRIGPFTPRELARVLKLCSISRLGRVSFVSCYTGTNFKGEKPYAQEFREALEAPDKDLTVKVVEIRDGIYGRLGEVSVSPGMGSPRGSKTVFPAPDSSSESSGESDDDEDEYPAGIIPKGKNKLRF